MAGYKLTSDQAVLVDRLGGLMYLENENGAHASIRLRDGKLAHNKGLILETVIGGHFDLIVEPGVGLTFSTVPIGPIDHSCVNIAEARYKTIKRKYGDVYPEIRIDPHATVRNKIVNYLGECGCSCPISQLEEFLELMANDEEVGRQVSRRWPSRNNHIITSKDGHYHLTKNGKRVYNYLNRHDPSKHIKHRGTITNYLISEDMAQQVAMYTVCLNEESVSKSQQRLFGMAYSVKVGDSKLADYPEELRAKLKDIVDGMTEDQLRDYASTKHDGLPEVVPEVSQEVLREAAIDAGVDVGHIDVYMGNYSGPTVGLQEIRGYCDISRFYIIDSLYESRVNG